MTLWGVPVTLIGVFPQQAAALALLAGVGVGNALIDLGGFTLLGRIAPDEVLARVFGVLESLVALSMGIGAMVTSLLVELVGVRPTLVVAGLLCPVCAVLSWPRLRRMDRSLDVRDREITLLQAVTMLNALPLPAIEQLARVLEPVEVAAGEMVFHQGDVGDRYFVIESGEAEVVGDGRVVATLEPGEGFGEIALLRGIRRTASVRASSALRLQALRSEHFLAVVLGFPPSARDAATRSTRCSTASPPPRPLVEPSERTNWQGPPTTTERSLLLIADIGGYTEYMRTHRMSLAHAEVNTAGCWSG